MIDTGFGNKISIDSVCVLSGFTVLTWVTYCTYSIGIYAFRVALKKSKLCFLIQLTTSILLGVVIFIFSDIIPYLYSLTDTQYDLFSDCLKIHAIFLPAYGISDFIHNYALLTCDNKHSFIGNAMYYTLMIISDASIIYMGGDLRHLLIATGICLYIHFFYMLVVTDFRKSKLRFNKTSLKILLSHGFATFINRITGKIATVFYNIWASRLGTELYAIHAVCYSIGIFTENFSNALSTFMITSLAKINDKICKYKFISKTLKKYSLFMFVSSYLVSYGLLLFTYGAVDISDCILWVALYSTEIFGVTLYEAYGAYLVSERKSGVYAIGGIFGIIVRIPAIMIGSYLGLGLYPFAFACMFDFGIRGLFYYYHSRKNYKKYQQ